MRIPLGVGAKDYNSAKSKGLLVNMIAETNQSGDYLSVRRCEGLTLYTTSPNDLPIRSNIHLNGGYKYYVAGTVLYRFTTSTPVSLGTVGGSGKATIASNSVPGNNQILILNGEGDGYIYDNSGLNQIVDVDFYSTTSVTVLNERFWLTRDDTNEFFASDVSDGTSYNPLSFGTAEWKPDTVQIVVSKKSALWVIGQSTMEYWQSYDDSIFPLRAVRGASQDIGILAKSSFAEIDDYFAFLSDDSNVMLVDGTTVKQISDLDFQTKIRGDGTSQNPGFTAAQIQECVGFWVDTPQHKIFYLSFPTAGYTWGYDMSTGLPLTRTSLSGLTWRALHSLTDQNQVLVGDRLDGSIWVMEASAKDEGGSILSATMRTPSVSFKKDAFISLLEVEMEVGVSETATEAQMIVRNSKDGGKTWITHSHIPLGTAGEWKKRVPIRNFGRVVRHKDMVWEFIVTDAVRVQFYEIDALIEEDAF